MNLGVEPIIDAIKNVDILFVAYYGVLAPAQKPRYKSTLDTAMLNLLREFANRKNKKLVFVTARSCDTVASYASLFDAIICCNGCEIQVENYIIVPRETPKKSHVIAHLQREAQRFSKIVVETKKTSLGDLVGLGFEWEGELSKPDKEVIEGIIRIALDNKLLVYSVPQAGFVDIYVPTCRRGEAVKLLKRLFSGSAAYIGEGVYDLDALEVVEVPIIVRHEFNKDIRIEHVYELSRHELLEIIRSVAYES